MVPAGKSKLMQQLRTELQHIASHSSSVLLIGEPGAGREAFARYLHERGPRAGSPFVTLVASSLREAEAESRLFGRVEGANRHPGLIEQAADGTLFLQEIMRRGVIAPSFVVSYSHSDADIDHTLDVIHAALTVYRRALEDGVDKYLHGRPVLPVFRRFV